MDKYTLIIEQKGYNRSKFEFNNLREMLLFMEEAMKYSVGQTTFSFQYTINAESEVEE